MEQLKPPTTPDFEASDLPQMWKRWKEEFMLYMDLAMNNQSTEIKKKMLLYLLGPKGREIYETFEIVPITVSCILDAFDKHCDPEKNETIERYKVFTRNQEVNEPFDQYLTELKVLSMTCNFGQLQESLLRDRIICGIYHANLRERLLREPTLNLDKCIYPYARLRSFQKKE
ncbi:hypothetical protein HOLleu_23209 [Holothuria leucospilota]|uniref:Retrotransposon gag domain-containing protein n=1 Tax=Holothuria leucospilota TaxID=206669 RepID=A0A9Q1BUH1_HOLLE|nr:hypothetical protein HOLleu_23209 [Holothuria leucospilota]